MKKNNKIEKRFVCSSCLELFDKKELVEVRIKSFKNHKYTHRTNYCKQCAKTEKHESI